MKTNRVIIYCLLVFAVAFLVMSCKENVDDSEYMFLSVDHYTFSGSGEDTLSLIVTSSGDWNVSDIPEWLHLDGEKGDTLHFVADKNGSGIVRNGEMFFVSGEMERILSVSQLPSDFDGRFEEFPGMSIPVMSRNGEWICGMVPKVLDDGWTIESTPVLINTITGERQKLTPSTDYEKVVAISDDASLIVYWAGDGITTYVRKDDCDFVNINLPEGYHSPTINEMSADGSVWVGFCKDGSNKSIPMKWINGESEVLDQPDKDLWGDTMYNGTIARGCSANGDVVYGSEWQTFGVVYWKDGEMYFPGKDYCEYVAVGENTVLYAPLLRYAQSYCISNNGKWLAVTYVGEGYYPGRINLETGEMKVMEDFSSEVNAFTVNDDGLVFAATPFVLSSDGVVYDFDSNTAVPLSEWFASEYGLKVADACYVEKISSGMDVYSGIHVIPTVNQAAFVGWYVRI